MVQNRFFTLIELLVVVAILAIIASMVHPTLKSGIESAHHIQCSTNYKHLYMAFEAYLQDSEKYPLTLTNKDGTERGGFTWDDHLAMGYDGRDLPYQTLKKYNLPASSLGTIEQQKPYQCPTAMEFRPETERAHRTYSYNTNQYWGPKEGFQTMGYWKRWSASINEVPNPGSTFTY